MASHCPVSKRRSASALARSRTARSWSLLPSSTVLRRSSAWATWPWLWSLRIFFAVSRVSSPSRCRRLLGRGSAAELWPTRRGAWGGCQGRAWGGGGHGNTLWRTWGGLARRQLPLALRPPPVPPVKRLATLSARLQRWSGETRAARRALLLRRLLRACSLPPPSLLPSPPAPAPPGPPGIAASADDYSPRTVRSPQGAVGTASPRAR